MSNTPLFWLHGACDVAHSTQANMSRATEPVGQRPRDDRKKNQGAPLTNNDGSDAHLPQRKKNGMGIGTVTYSISFYFYFFLDLFNRVFGASRNKGNSKTRLKEIAKFFRSRRKKNRHRHRPTPAFFCFCLFWRFAL
jgi:hypothetical protein